MAQSKKSFKRPQIDQKLLAEKKEKRKTLILRILALGLAGLMVLGVAISAIAGM
ncbi:MAG: hypothetical protein IJ031_04230 [Oscillospiraceae bacterium]|nr:hypothetical protein [Oscillospiraceae bacterium]MBQ8883785.1 hypothetical protein [Oscillospiraceae bacterium]